MTAESRFSSKIVHTNVVNIEGISPVKEFDPFASRKVENPTTNFDTLAHLLKAVFGTGILAMPLAFRHAGLLLGGIGALLIGFISTHCAYILVKCAHILYYKTERTKMTFPDVAEQALATGPKSLQKYSKFGRYLVEVTLFVAYFGTCSVFAVVAAGNYRTVYDAHMGNNVTNTAENLDGMRWTISYLLIPLVLLSWIPDLKYLVPISMFANFLMITSVAMIFYWIFVNFATDGFHPEKFNYYPSFEDFIKNFPKFFSTVIFAMESIGVIMPIENKMKTPKKFIGTFGVLNLGMTGITSMYIIIGVLGYMNDPESDKSMIVLEMPSDKWQSQLVRIFVGTSVVCTCRLLFSVCLEIAEDWMKNFYAKESNLVKYIFRTTLMTLCVLLAVLVPTIPPFMNLIGAFCFSIQGFIIPVIIEIITRWDMGFGSFKWIAIKNVIIIIVAIFAIVYGTIDAIADIVKIVYK